MQTRKNQGLFGKGLTSFPNDKILDFPKLKAFADDKINEAHKLKFVSEMVENIARKGEINWLPAFSPFPQCFQVAFRCFVKTWNYAVTLLKTI